MTPSTKEVYSLFVKNHKVFSSVEEILHYKQLWPCKSFVEDKVFAALPCVKPKKYHLGLDISSRSTGLCILDNQYNVLGYDAIHPPSECKSNSILSASFIFDAIQHRMKHVDPELTMSEWNIVIEKYLQMFGTSSFRTQSLFYLAEINGIIQYKCWETMKSFPLTIHPSSARSLLHIQSAGSREETKKVVLAHVQKETGDQIEWPQKKRVSSLSDECFDIADAYVLAKAGCIENYVDSILDYYQVNTAMNGKISTSSVFSDFVKINLVHFIKKYADDDAIQSIDSLPLALQTKYYTKLRDLIKETVVINLNSSHVL